MGIDERNYLNIYSLEAQHFSSDILQFSRE